MKKFYALAIAAVAAVAANAQVYFVGDFQGWNPAEPLTATTNADGNYEMVIDNCAGFKMSKTFGDWDTFNAEALSAKEGNITADDLNTWLTLEPWGENTNLPSKGKWTIIVKADYSAMQLSMEGELKDPDAYVVGDMTEWGFQAAWMMTSVKKFEYTFNAAGETKIPAATEFKLAADGWSLINYSCGGEILADGEPSEVSYNIGDNMYFAEDFEGVILLELTAYNEAAQMTATPSAGVANIAVDAAAEAVYYNLQGVKVANPESGLYIVRRGDKVAKVLVK